MPNQARVVVEVELTPQWWLRLASNLNGSEAASPLRELHAQAVAVAFELGGVQLLKTKRSRFVARVTVPTGVTFEELCARAGAIVDRLNALDVSCLPGARSPGNAKTHGDG